MTGSATKHSRLLPGKEAGLLRFARNDDIAPFWRRHAPLSCETFASVAMSGAAAARVFDAEIHPSVAQRAHRPRRRGPDRPGQDPAPGENPRVRLDLSRRP